MRSLKRVFITSIVVALTIISSLVPVLPISAAVVSVTVSPATGAPGTQVTVSGNGFKAGSGYTVTLSIGTPIPTITTIATGTVPTGGAVAEQFPIPPLARGKYSVSISTNATPPDTTATPLPLLTITPAITLTTSSGIVGDKFKISGNGFNPAEKINILLDTTSIATPTTDATGSFNATEITIPSLPGGSHTISAKDIVGSSPAVAFSVTPKITASASEATVNSVVLISGNGFAASKALSFRVDNTVLTGSATTDTNGAFTDYKLTIPPVSGGTHTITAKDAADNFGQIDFTLVASIVINPAVGPVGTKVTITGYGFLSSNDNPVTITLNGNSINTEPSPISVDNGGGFGANIVIPAGAGGVLKITAKDKTSTVSADFTCVAKIAVSPASGTVGTTVTAAGSGVNGLTTVTVNFDGTKIQTATTDKDGKFSTTFVVANAAAGKHQITVTDGVNPVNFDFTVTATTNVSALSGYVGKDITASGTGYAAGGSVSVKYDTTEVAAAKTDANGSFSATFKAPASPGGKHLITISDGVITETRDFTMDSTPPAAPALVSPATNTKAAKTPLLDWQNVTDESGVTYSLQVAKDPRFDIVLIQQDGLQVSQYQVAASEAFGSVSKDNPYYWRVKATDGANNQSGWSAPFTFYVGTVVPTSTYVLIVIGLCVVVGGAAFLIEKIRSR